VQGQWIGRISGNFEGTLRVELERRRGRIVGNAYLFYDVQHFLPGFQFPISMPDEAPYETQVITSYCYAEGGKMSWPERHEAEKNMSDRFGIPTIPAAAVVNFEVLKTGCLHLKWAGDGQSGSETILLSDAGGESEIVSRSDLITWDDFRQWSIGQEPRRYIFRGQANPFKLTTTFHRTWRNDLSAWITDDVSRLYGAIIEKISYPLELGKIQHNAVIWSILQHHGYPTPLLDWTFSPFVAAYFAFESARRLEVSNPRIFIFDKTAWEASYGRQTLIADAAPPQFITLENMSVGNPRSGPQQALSAVSNVTDIEAFIREREKTDRQTYLQVCDLNSDESPKIMRELELMGITYGSLFPGLDGICRDLKDRLFNRFD